MKSIIVFVILVLGLVQAQNFFLWKSGSSFDYTPTQRSEPLLMLAGGGSDNDDAMTALITAADSGDVLILRTSGTNGYNNYLFSQLGVPLNSVISIRLINRNAAFESSVIDAVAKAEVIFFAGGDQNIYKQFLENTPLIDTLNYKINHKEVSIGGTSAGAMILGTYYYSAENQGALSSTLLANPLHPDGDSILPSFIQTDSLTIANTPFIVDTHFDQRNRLGRMAVFFKKVAHLWYKENPNTDLYPVDRPNITAIGINEVTALIMKRQPQKGDSIIVYGDTPNHPDYVYWMDAGCASSQSERLFTDSVSTSPLVYPAQNEEIQMWRFSGMPGGDTISAERGNYLGVFASTFNFNGTVASLKVGPIELQKDSVGWIENGNNCVLVNLDEKENSTLIVYRNNQTLYVQNEKTFSELKLYDLNGRVVAEGSRNQIELPPLAAAFYIVEARLENNPSIRVKILLN